MAERGKLDTLQAVELAEGVEIADHASALTGTTGDARVKRMLAMARWVGRKRD